MNELEELNRVERSIGDQTGDEFTMQELLYSSDLPLLPPWKFTEREPLSPSKLISKMLHGSPMKARMSMSCSNGEFDGLSNYRPAIALPEKGLTAKMENKYTLRIKTYGINGVADDGYKWRKYGQKSIKNSPNPRSYYRCTNPRCNAKRQVERSTEDPDMLIITYEGLHLHYTYSHFLHSQAHDLSITKKPKTNSVDVQPRLFDQDQHLQTIVLQEPLIIGRDGQQDNNLVEVEGFGKSAMGDEIMQEETLYNNNKNNRHCSQGLLEDIVPLMVRKPSSPTTSSNEPSYPSQASSPSYSSSLCWTPETFHFAESVLSSIV
ncbi:probable WRKY transcription factor 49 [Dendrobium catenatum]|nr:probable WRKY transcription factor 49 [Dendrobium catenatum]